MLKGYMKGFIGLAVMGAMFGAGYITDLRAEEPASDPVQIATNALKTAPTPGVAGSLQGKRLMYTTYFYTANEAVVHGYEKDTKVRIISLEQGGTIWEGVVGQGEAKLIPTGRGVFSFVSDKKASILVGTPSKCAVVGYWVRDREGSYRSNHLISQLPGMTHFGTDRVIIWAWEDTEVQITNTTNDQQLYSGKIKKGEHYTLPKSILSQMHSHVIDVRTKNGKPDVAVQVYYDEGFFVPSKDGRTAGTEFMTYIGATTTGENDLQLFSYGTDAKVKVEDITTKKVVWEGTVKGDSVETITLKDNYLRITSDREISASVTPYKHYVGPYQEHHFGAGQEGTGIENNFLMTTPKELWVFSYFDDNPVTVTNMTTNKVVWEGKINKNKPVGVHPGHGFYRIRSAKGVSAMGGAEACGAEFSPAGKLFELDEELLKIVQQIKEERIEKAKAAGVPITAAEASAPLNKEEVKKARKAVNKKVKRDFSDDEVEDRVNSSMQTY